MNGTEDAVMACLQDILGPIEIQRLIKQAHDDISMVKMGYRLRPTKDKEEQKRRKRITQNAYDRRAYWLRKRLIQP